MTALGSTPDVDFVADRTRSIVFDVLPADIERRTDDAYLGQDLGADSLDHLQIAFELSDAFGIPVEDDEISAAISVGGVVRLVHSKLEAAAAAVSSKAEVA